MISTRAPVFTEPRNVPASDQPAILEETPRQAPRQVAPDQDTTGAIPVERPEEVDGGDPTIRQVQSVLRDLGLYRGTIDGLEGPETRTAIGNYRRIVDLDPTPTIISLGACGGDPLSLSGILDQPGGTAALG